MVRSQSHGNSSSPHHDDGASPLALNNLKKIANTNEVLSLQKALECELYLVGGLVRDLLSDPTNEEIPAESIHDLDIALVLSPEEATAKLSKAGIKSIPTGIEHGTITAVVDGVRSPLFSGKLQIQLTTFRQPGARLSTNYSKTIEEDLAGRDFTINAIAFGVQAQKLIDPFSGVQDIHDNLLRAVGAAVTRFEEDPHRILRMVRFGAASNRMVDEKTLLAAKAKWKTLSTISVERIRDEFVKILTAPCAGAGLAQLKDVGILDWLVPEVVASYGLEQNEFHTEDVFQHTLTVVDGAESTPLVRLAAFFHDLGKPSVVSTGEDNRRHFYLHEQKSAEIARAVMTRLKFSNADIQEVELLVAYHMRPLDCGAPGARRLIRDLGTSFDRWRALKIADAPPIMPKPEFEKMLGDFDSLITTERARNFTSPYSKLAITGNDIMGLGIGAGPQVGKILKDLLELVADDPEKNNKETLLREAKKRI